jgi:hypothetical protein
MAFFRGYCLDKENHVVAAMEIDAADLATAVNAVRSFCCGQPGADPCRVEVWVGTECVYPAMHVRP